MRWAGLLSELYALSSRGIDPGLERVIEALARIGDPHTSMQVVHVAGTNGKGSTSRMIAEGIVSDDGCVGLFTSPHLHSLTERFVIGGEPAERGALIDAWAEIGPRIGGIPLTFFETITVLAFALFRARGVRVAVLETGLGGRLDATNVVERPIVTAITRVALDHQSWLGETIEEIAREKAGIMKPGVPAVVGSQDAAVDGVLDEVAAAVGAPVVRPRFDGPSSGFEVRWGVHVSPLLSLRLRGDHQRENAAVAVAALGAIEEASVARVDPGRGVAARWPGRAELCPGEPSVVFDVAHNPNGARALGAWLKSCSGSREERVLVFGAMKDKDHAAMLTELRPHVSRVFLTRPELTRAAEPDEMAEAGDVVVPDIEEALHAAREHCAPSGLVIVTGSTFVVAEARAVLLGIENDPPIAF